MDPADDPLIARLARARLEARAIAIATSRAVSQSERIVQQCQRLREMQSLAIDIARRRTDEAALPKDVSGTPDFLRFMR